MNLKFFESWEKQQLVTFTKGKETIYLVVEYNVHYGDLITRFQIGEKESDTGVTIKGAGIPCKFSESNNLIGERPFEQGSITYEFLYKPLGLSIPEKKICGETAFSLLESFAKEALKAGWKCNERDYFYLSK